jgi:SAM-dependent methyltransferase
MGDYFSEQAELYARYRPTYPDEMYEFILDHLHQTKNAWDCGTGSGQVARKLSEYFDCVYATDISQQQMDLAVQKKNITYLEASAEDSGLPADTFDLITVAQAIHWFDFDRFYDEVRRTANQNGLLAVIGYMMLSINPEIDPIISNLYDEAFGKFFNENRKYINEAYRNIPFPFEEIATPNFEFSASWSLDELEGFFNSWSAIQKIKNSEGYNPANKTLEQIGEKISDTQQHLDVTFPVVLRLGRVYG